MGWCANFNGSVCHGAAVPVGPLANVKVHDWCQLLMPFLEAPIPRQCLLTQVVKTTGQRKCHLRVVESLFALDLLK